MANPDTRAAYELLLRAMRQKYRLEQVDGVNPRPSGGDGTQQGLLARLRAQENERIQQRPTLELRQEVTPQSLDPNFRQLSRLPVAEVSPSASAPLQPSGPAMSSGYSVESGPSFEVDGIPQNYTNRKLPAPPWLVPSPAPMTTFSGGRLRGIPVPLPPTGPVSLPPIPMPRVPDWWNDAARILQLFPRGLYGDNRNGRGGRDAYNRCIDAAEGDVEDWENFCRFLDRGQLHVAGGGRQNGPCWSKTYESEVNKKIWCENQFGGH